MPGLVRALEVRRVLEREPLYAPVLAETGGLEDHAVGRGVLVALRDELVGARRRDRDVAGLGEARVVDRDLGAAGDRLKRHVAPAGADVDQAERRALPAAPALVPAGRGLGLGLDCRGRRD